MLSCVPKWVKPKNLILGLRPKTEFFTVRKREFAPFVFAYSDSGDSFGLQSWGSDWGEAWTQSLQTFDTRYFCNIWLDPQTSKKKNLLCTQSLMLWSVWCHPDVCHQRKWLPWPCMTQNTTGFGGSPVLLAHESQSGAGSTCHLQHS